MVSEKAMQYVLQAVVAVSLIVLAGLQMWRGGPVADWLGQAIMVIVGALFGVSALNGFVNARKK